MKIRARASKKNLVRRARAVMLKDITPLWTNLSERTQRVVAWAGCTGLLAPNIAVLGWLHGYGPNGMHELLSGYIFDDLIGFMTMAGVFYGIAFAIPRVNGLSLLPWILATVISLFFFAAWSGIAAGIASV